MENGILKWLSEGDPALKYQVKKDLLDQDDPSDQLKIEETGWGNKLIAKRKENGHWGLSFYQPKWISTHYTLLELRNLCIRPDHPLLMESSQKIAWHEKGKDGGINPSGTVNESDVCINGMFLDYGCYFGVEQASLESVVDFILSQKMSDGGFNCRLNRSGARHSSMHTTISTLEGIASYHRYGYTYRLEELLEAQKSSEEFLLQHKLFRSDRTGEIIHQNFVRMPYPCRWRYDFLRALDYFQSVRFKPDGRLDDAISLLKEKRHEDGYWKLNAKYPGKVHFEMEKAGKPSRWNTLRALRVLKHFSASGL